MIENGNGTKKERMNNENENKVHTRGEHYVLSFESGIINYMYDFHK